MSREDGFPIADIDSGYLEDAKMRLLWQRILDEDRMARAVLLHKATLLASWRHGERVTVGEAAPLWLTVDPVLVEHLQAVRLLDKDGRVGRASWNHWFGSASARRASSRERGRLGGLARARNRASSATAQLERSSSPALPVRPVLPTYQPASPAGAREGESDAADPADAYWTVTGKYPTDATLRWIDDLAGTYGAVAVIRAIATCHQADATTQTLLGRTKAVLQRDARKLDRAERAAEQARVADLRKPTVLRRMAEDITEEEADRIARAYRARHAAPATATEEVGR